MTKEEFIKKAASYGMKDEEIYSAYKKLEADGEFSDSPKYEAPEVEENKSTFDSVAESFYPRTMAAAQSAKETGGPTLGKFVKEGLPAAVLDAASMAGRGVASIPALMPGGEKFSEAFKRTESDKSGIAGFVGDVVRDPATMGGAITGGLASGAMRGAGLIKPAMSLGSKVLTGMGIGAAEGLGSGVTRGIENVSSGEQTLGEAAKSTASETAISAGGGGIIPAGIAGIKGGLSLTNKMLGGLAQEISGVSEEALRKYGFGLGEGAKQLKKASGTEGIIADKLVEGIDNFDDFIPEKEIISNTLNKMPPMRLKPIIDAIDNAKVMEGSESAIRANKRLDRLKAIYQNLSEEDQAVGVFSQDGTQIGGAIATVENPLSPKNFRELRMQLDSEIKSAFGKDAGQGEIFEKAALKIRTAMKNELEEAAERSGNPEYIEAMKGYSEKLNTLDEIRGYIGSNAATRDRKKQAFIDNLFGKNSKDRQRVMADLGKIFGEDFLQESKLAQLAEELGPDGRATFFPRQTNGRSWTGLGAGFGQIATGTVTGQPGLVGSGIGTLALASPKTSAGTLSLMSGIEKGLPALGEMSAPALRASLRGLTEEQIAELAKTRSKK